jgi:hypothetical protein
MIGPAPAPRLIGMLDSGRVFRPRPAWVVAIATAAAAGIISGLGNPNIAAASLLFTACVGCFLFWKQGVYLVVGLAFVEGYFRNRLDAPAIVLVKDLLLGAIYLRVLGEWLIRRDRPPVDRRLVVPIFVFAAVAGLEMLNPNILSPLEGLVGLRTWLFYIPLFFVGAQMGRSGRARRLFLGFILVTALPLCGFGLAQYLGGYAAYAGQPGAFGASTFVTVVGPTSVLVFRPSGTFSFPSPFAAYVAIVTLLAIGTALHVSTRWRVPMWLLVAFLLATDVIAGQRTYLLLLPVLALVLVLLTRAKVSYIGAAVAVVAAGIGVVGSQYLQVDHTSALTRPLALLLGQDQATFGIRTSTFLDSIRDTVVAAPLGFGTGATSIGSRYVVGQIPVFVEFSITKVLGDLGVIGLAAYAWMFWALFRASLRALGRARAQDDLAGVALAVVVLTIQVLVAYSGYDLAVTAVLFWFLSGLLTANVAPAAGGETRTARAEIPWNSNAFARSTR